jgi:hypothetical protein
MQQTTKTWLAKTFADLRASWPSDHSPAQKTTLENHKLALVTGHAFYNILLKRKLDEQVRREGNIRAQGKKQVNAFTRLVPQNSQTLFLSQNQQETL